MNVKDKTKFTDYQIKDIQPFIPIIRVDYRTISNIFISDSTLLSIYFSLYLHIVGKKK